MKKTPKRGALRCFLILPSKKRFPLLTFLSSFALLWYYKAIGGTNTWKP